MIKRFFSFCLTFLLIFNLSSQCVFATITESASATQASFLNFAATGGSNLEMNSMTSDDYYALSVFMSNYFEPGVTTLEDLLAPTDTEFFNAFSSNLGKVNSANGQDQLANIVAKIGMDTKLGLDSGVCTLLNSDGTFISGRGFLQGITASMDLSKTANGTSMGLVESNGSKVCYQDSSHLAFNFSSPVIKASWQTLASYSPGLFVSNKGIDSLDLMFIDVVGNVWGFKSPSTTIPIPQDKNDLRGFFDISYIDANGDEHIMSEYVYLILPACLNPSTFTHEAKSGDTKQLDLKMPLMNSYILNILMSESDLKTGSTLREVSEKYVPYYNLASVLATNSKAKTKTLTVFGMTSLSPYTFNLNTLDSKTIWTYRGFDVANILFGDSQAVLSPVNGNDLKGRAKFDSHAFIVFSPNLRKVTQDYASTTNESEGTDGNVVVDLETGSFNPFAGKGLFSVFANNANATDAPIDQQIKLFIYLFSATALSINQVSMSFYLPSEEGVKTDSPTIMEEFLRGLNGYDAYQEKGYDPNELIETQLGLKGLDLFFDSDGSAEVELQSKKYKRFVPDRIVDSKFIIELVEGNSYIGYENCKKLSNSLSDTSFLTSGTIAKDLMDNEANSSSWSSMGFGTYSLSNPSDTTKTESRYKITLVDVGTSLIRPKEWVGLTDWDSGASTSFGLSRMMTLEDLEFLQDFGINATESGDFKTGGPTIGYTYPNSSILDNFSETDDYDIQDMTNYLSALYGYSLFFPSENTVNAMSNTGNYNSIAGDVEKQAILGDSTFVQSRGFEKTFLNGNGELWMGLYMGYMVDMFGIDCDGTTIGFGNFNSPFLPSYNISASGEINSDTSLPLDGDYSGVVGSEDRSFEDLQKDIIYKINGILSDGNNDYRNGWLKNILDGILLTIHQTVVGSWATTANTVTTGANSTYQSITGYVYTPTLEELSFTSNLMNNYLEIYVICMVFIVFVLILMMLLHIRTWQQGVFTFIVMSVALLFPYLLISNTISVGNKISNEIYSDRFDFWAMIKHQSSISALSNTTGMDEKDQLISLTFTSVDTSRVGDPGIKVKWMSPKKAEMFNSLYTDPSLNNSFVTNMTIYKWLFSSFVYDSEFVEVDKYGSFVYRPYNSIVAEAKAYYSWGLELQNNSDFNTISDTLKVSKLVDDSLQEAYETDGDISNYMSVYARMNPEAFFGNDVMVDSFTNNLFYHSEKISDINAVSQYNTAGSSDNSDKLGAWGILSTEISEELGRNFSINTGADFGILSNLPVTESETYFSGASPDKISKALFLKNTESPYYYFYSVLKSRYGDANESGGTENFKKSLLDERVFKIMPEDIASNFNTNRNVLYAYRDFLDLEGLFSYVIPYLTDANQYVEDYRNRYDDTVESYDFEMSMGYEDASGNIVNTNSEGENSSNEIEFVGENKDNIVSEYKEAATRKYNMSRVWNMYSPWVDSLNDLDVRNVKVSVGGVNKYIENALNPSCYYEEGRPMIFSEADGIVKGYSYKDLTDIERKIQSVTEKTYKDIMYLLNYYDLDSEVLLSASAMYATFNFNSEFSETKFLTPSVMLYPQGYELKNFNYDAFMRLALLNSTGESVFTTDDLYSRILSKTSIITGIFLILSDIIACVAIPFVKFIIILGLLFLGLVICISCVVNPPDKMAPTIAKSLLVPSLCFLVLNIAFSWCLSLVVGEGLTAYVGSKGVNIATNDPNITILLIALLGVAYIYACYRIIKMLIEAYKQYGLSSALATIGLVGSAVSAIASKTTKKGLKLVGHGASGVVGAGIGAVTAGKGNRLAGAYEGIHKGTRGIIDRRIKENRQKEWLQGNAGANSNKVTEEINAKASGKRRKGKSSINENKSLTFNQEYAKLLAQEKEAGYESKSTVVSRGVNRLNKLRHKAMNAFSAVGSVANTAAYAVSHPVDFVITTKNRAVDAVKNYSHQTLTDIADDNDRLESIRMYQEAKRSTKRFATKEKIISSDETKKKMMFDERQHKASDVREAHFKNGQITIRLVNDVADDPFTRRKGVLGISTDEKDSKSSEKKGSENSKKK